MPDDVFDPLRARLRGIRPARSVGQITALGRDHVAVAGLDRIAALGDRVRIGDALTGEVLRIDAQGCTVMPEGATDGIRLGQTVTHLGPATLSPHSGWLGRVIDPDGRPLDGRPLFPGPCALCRCWHHHPHARSAVDWGGGCAPGLRSSTRCCRSSEGRGSGCSQARAWASRA